jgi:hypothetical protein
MVIIDAEMGDEDERSELQEKLSDVFEAASPPKPEVPMMVYHYTTGDGLIGILQRKCFRATHFAFQNDRSEWMHAVAVAEEWAESLDEPLRGFVMESCRRARKSQLPPLPLVPHVTCFSEVDDSLSQWRAYSEDADGYAIGLDLNAWSDRQAASSRWQIVSMIYERSTQQQYLNEGLAKMWEIVQGGSDEDKQQGVHHASSLLFRLAASYKHHTFHEEREWRLLAWVPTHTIGESALAFRSTKYGIAPYIELRFDNEANCPIRKIVLGPKSNPRHGPLGVEMLLKASGYRVRSEK